MRKMIKAKKMRAACTKEEESFMFLKVHYGKNYMGQIMIQNPKKDIPKMIKALRSGLKLYKTLLKNDLTS